MNSDSVSDEGRAEDPSEAAADAAEAPEDQPVVQGARISRSAAIRRVEFADAGRGDSALTSNIDLLLDVPLELTVELGRTTMSIRNILSLGSGSVVELQKLAGEPVDILVNNRPIATGEVVVVDDNFGVRIADILDPKKRIESLA